MMGSMRIILNCLWGCFWLYDCQYIFIELEAYHNNEKSLDPPLQVGPNTNFIMEVVMTSRIVLLHKTLLTVDDVKTRSCDLVDATTAEIVDTLLLVGVYDNTSDTC